MLDGCTPWPRETAARFRDRGYWRGETLPGLLDSAVRRNPDKPALIQAGSRVTYRDLDLWSRRMAAGFQRHGVARDDRVVVQLPSAPEFIAVCFALFRLGAKPVFSLPAHRFSEISHLCDLSGATSYVFPAAREGFDYADLARRVREACPGLRRVFAAGDPAVASAAGQDVVTLDEVDADPVEFPPADPQDVAFFLLSGGTTALPKLIPRTHDDYAYQVRAVSEASGLIEDDVYLATLPSGFNFTWGCPGIVGTLRAGGTVVLAGDPTPDTCFDAIERERVTFTSVVPSVLQLWLEARDWLDADLSSLRFLQVGSAKVYPHVAARVQPAFGCRIQQVFGMAEGLLTVTRPDDPEEIILTTQGSRISPADEIRIVDGQDTDLPPGETGELLARGPYTLRGYYRAPDHNKRAFTPKGFYRSGDLARLTPEGNLVIEGRIKDVVIRGGDKISAAEVEEQLLAHPAVARAAVVPVPDEFYGELVCAYVVPRGNPPTLGELKQALQASGLADFKLPERLVCLEELPLTGLGKVDKKTLAGWAAKDSPAGGEG